MIIALLSWYDEDPRWLKRCVDSLAQIPVDRLVALDGPYELYGGRPKSRQDEYEAIEQAPFPTHVYTGGYEGNEVEKRNRLWELAERHSEPNDWYMVIDADEYVTQAPEGLAHSLDTSFFDVGAVDLQEPGHPLGTIHFPTFPMFFRAIRGLHCDRDHFTYRAPDGRTLWGNAKTERLEARHMTGATVMHESQLRHPERRAKAMAYYKSRDMLRIENLPPAGSKLVSAAYEYNPACDCEWCLNKGEIPQGTPDNGHSFGYGHPHVPLIPLAKRMEHA